MTSTDTTSTAYRNAIERLLRAMSPPSPLLVAAGHEHSLQIHHDELGLYYAVSGAGSAPKVDRVSDMPTLMRASAGSSDPAAWAEPGYMRLDLHESGDLELTTFVVQDDGQRREVFRHCLLD